MVQNNDETQEKSANSAVPPLDNNRERRNSVVQSNKNNETPSNAGINADNNIPIKNAVPVVPDDKKSKSIGHYILGKKLGEGTFGKVKLATHVYTGEKVAIKILEKDRIIDVSDVERVSREIHILKLLRHSNIIQLYEIINSFLRNEQTKFNDIIFIKKIIETPKQLFLIMEYASGGELFDYIVANKKVKEREAARFFLQIISGIEYIHKLNIVHRDMKPENLLLNHDKSIKIVDFGLSNTYKKNELLKTACGSPCYAAPEMIAGKRYHGLGVDIWSCGVILFALLCGCLPFEDPNTANLYKKILAGDFTIPSFVSQDAQDLMKNILNTDPQKRYTVEDIRNHPWCNQYKLTKTPEGIIVGYNRIPVDVSILKQLENFNFNLDYAQKCIDANKHNHVTTCYYLLLKKHIKNGGKSVADISSDDFDSSLLLPNKRPAKTPHKEQYGSDLMSIQEEKENHIDMRSKNSVLNSRKESRDHSYSYTNGNTYNNSKLCSSQNSASKDMENILNNNTAQLNSAVQYKKENMNNTSMTLDQKSTATSKHPSYKTSKRNSIQTNKLLYNSDNQYPSTTKPATTNNNYLFDSAQMANHVQPHQKIHSQTNQQSIQQQIIYQQQQLQQNYIQPNSALTSGNHSPYKQHQQQYTPYQNNPYQNSNNPSRNTPLQQQQHNPIQTSYLNETLKSVEASIHNNNNNKIPLHPDSSYNNSPRMGGKDPMEKLRSKIKETNQKRSNKANTSGGNSNLNDSSFVSHSNESARQLFNIPGTLGQRMRFANIKKNPNTVGGVQNNNQNIIPQSTLPSRGYSQGRESKSHTSSRQKYTGNGAKTRGVTHDHKGVSPVERERERGKSTEPFDDCNTSGYRILGIMMDNNNCNTSLNNSGYQNNIANNNNNPTLTLNSTLKNNTTNPNNYSFDLGNYAQLQLSQQQQIQITQQLNSSYGKANGYSNSNINNSIIIPNGQGSNTTKSNSQSHRRGKSSPLQNILNNLDKQKNIQSNNNSNNYSFNNSFNLNNTYNGPSYASNNYTTKHQNQQYSRKQVY